MDVMQGYRLSPKQKNLWQKRSGPQAFRAQCAIQITGNLRVAALMEAVQEVVVRHEILRTVFQCPPGTHIPVQVILESSQFSWQEINLRNISPELQVSKIEEVFEEEGRQSFNFEKGPLLRLKLLALSKQRHILLVTLPALCADAWTLKNLVREFSLFFSHRETDHILGTPMQYADYAEWHHAFPEKEDSEAAKEFWKRLDLSAFARAKLPLEKWLEGKQVFDPRVLRTPVEEKLVRKLLGFAQELDTTISTILLCCWNVLLRKLSGEEELIVGTLHDGRGYAEMEEAMGLFAIHLPLLSHLSEDLQFRDFVKQIKCSLEETHRWQDGFDWETVKKSNGDINHCPYCFEFIDLSEELTANDLSFSIHQQVTCIDLFKVKLACVQTKNSLNTEIQYDPLFHSKEDIERLTAQFQALLEGLVKLPDSTIGDMEFLSARERQQVLFEFNRSEPHNQRDDSVLKFIEEQASQRPDHVAVICKSQHVSYAELNSLANRLARYLQGLGVGPEVPVAICVERSVEMVVGILAILKAGGAWLALDPDYPGDRLTYMLEDSQAPVLVSQSHLLTRLPQSQRKVVMLDTDWAAISSVSNQNFRSGVTLQNLAYIIYTSGSTGKPKGVMITHANMSNYVQALPGPLNITSDDRYLHTASISFSSSVRQLMVPLSKGATVVVATSDQIRQPLALFAQIQRERVTVIDIVPSYWRLCIQVLEALEKGERMVLLKNNLQLILSASEPLLSDLPQRWKFGFAHAAQLINMFGQTETCGIVATYPIPDQRDVRSRIISIGRPIANSQIYLLDARNRPVPIGVPGEIHIGGCSLGRGYLNQPELTAKKFIRNPFSRDSKTRLYKTGDLARYLPDGNIEFLGRLDNQVKIRGFRIEPAEIEILLNQHPAVRESAVVAEEEEAAEKRLVAYVVLDQKGGAEASQLRDYLQEKVPNYMVPAAFVFLKGLPRTPTGKLIRRDLPAPPRERPKTNKSFVLAETETQKKLVAIWIELLRLGQVGIHDDFFELGGQSLLATRLMSRLREAFQVEVPLRSLFEAPTVAGLAEAIEVLRQGRQRRVAEPILPVHRDGPLPLSYAQQRLWFLDQLDPSSAAYNMMEAFRLRGPLQKRALEKSLEEIVRRHEALRTRFVIEKNDPVQEIGPATAFPLHSEDLTAAAEEQRELVARRRAMEEALCPFDLATGPLMRARLMRLDAEEHVLLLTLHHIASDGWSMGVLFRELSALYSAFSQGGASPLPPLKVQYADYAMWQRKWLQGEVLQNQLAYWKQQLGGELPALELPTDRPRPAVQTFHGSVEDMVLSKSETEGLKRLSRREGVTLFMTLLAAFQTLLHRYSGQEDIVVGTPIAGRNRPEIEGLIGFFVNTLALRTNLSGNPTFRELLARVQEVALAAFSHQELPFEILVEHLQPERDPGRNPLFQVMFVFQNVPRESLKLTGVSTRPMSAGRQAVKFDLTLSMEGNEEGLEGRLEYNTDLFDGTNIRRMLGHFKVLLEGIIAEPEQRLSKLPFLTEAERHQLLVEWNAQQRHYPEEKCVHQLIEEQVGRTPDAVAVVFEDEHLTYQQLNDKANQVALSLAKRGIGKGSYIPILMDRSIEVVISILSIMKAGAAFVPLDIQWPAERIKQVLLDLNSEVILVNKVTPYREEVLNRSFLLVDGRVACDSMPSLNLNIDSGEPIYAIYTSGSTGKPKAAVVPHRGITNRFLWMNEFFGRDTAVAALQTTPHNFDSAIWQLFWPLINGGKTVIPSSGSEMTANFLSTLIERHAVTITDFVPSVFNVIVPDLLIDRSIRQKLRSLRIVIVGGEEITTAATHSFVTHFPGVRLINLYGPTEASIGCICYEITGKERGKIPIGKPISNVQVLILDQNRNLVPVGVVGELYLSGICLGLGYLNDEKKTEAAFVDNWLTEIDCDKLYKTGDLARYLPDGNIEFLGRLDQQVKIRGFRIELGEIESVLCIHPQVREAIVVAREDGSGGKRLVAYVVLKPGKAATVNELRGYLRQKLPDYMVPASFVFLESLPLTPNGKVDRKALPDHGPQWPDLRSVLVAPRTPIEEILADIWCHLLGLSQIGVEDNFFDLGGHSLLAMQMISRVRHSFQIELPVRRLFETPTISGLAMAVVEFLVEKTAAAEDSQTLNTLEER
ncbi:MAG TPA: amino acid adenylation domain-containing protein [Terriglobia bacterium]|nr:amino acid adenylation domain-containing protein [Terriglobia bacterium]